MAETVKWDPSPEPHLRRWVRCQAHPRMYEIAVAVSQAYGLSMPLSWELLLNFAFWGRSPEQVIKSMFVAAGRCSKDAIIVIDDVTGKVSWLEPEGEGQNA